ncbi:MAG: hypothetical protein Q9180_005214, partial [Flavoplaca navasiana]
DPTRLTMIGQPVDTMGDFPITAAISRKIKIACIGNSGAQAGIACFSMHHRRDLKPLSDSPIVFPRNQTTPPAGPFNTVSHIFFNQDETMLFITVKGDPMKNTTGFLSMLPVQENGIGTQDTRSSPPSTQVLFGSTIIPDSNNIVATDAAFGAATISTDGTPAILHKTTIQNQSATCWAAVPPVTKTAFVVDVGTDNIVEVDPASGEVLQDTALMSDNQGHVSWWQICVRTESWEHGWIKEGACGACGCKRQARKSGVEFPARGAGKE